MDAKTELENYWLYQKLIPCNNDELARLEQMETFPMTNETAAKFATYKADVEANVTRCLELMEAIETAISDIQNERHRAILWFKYVEKMTWREVAETLGFNHRNIQSDAVKAISRLTIPPLMTG